MVKAVVGANWGDEGKGKITDMLAKQADIIVRFQGGANAGHTIVNDYGKFALHTLPSGVFYSHTTSVIGNGVALDIPRLFKEIKSITDRNVPMPKILVSNRAQIVMPYHVLFDQYEEERLGGKSFGSTKSGIAPFYSDKYAKIGFQVSELFDENPAAYCKICFCIKFFCRKIRNNIPVIPVSDRKYCKNTKHLPGSIRRSGRIFQPKLQPFRQS